MDAGDEDYKDNNAGEATSVSPTVKEVNEELEKEVSFPNDPNTEEDGNTKELRLSDEVEEDAANTDTKSENKGDHPSEDPGHLARETTEERPSSSKIEFPMNVETPDQEDGDAIEITATLSREGTDIKDDSIEFSAENGPKATTTPPPAHEEISTTQTVMLSESPQIEASCEEISAPEFPLFDRAQLLEKYREALEERAQLQNLNTQLQHKLAEFFKKKKTDDKAHELDKSVTDQEQRYLKYMSNLEELHNQKRSLGDIIKAQIEDLKTKCSDKQSKVQNASDEFSTFKYEVAKNSVSNRSGKPLQPKDLEQIRTLETKKESEVIQVRLENIKLKNRLKKRELQLKAKEELAEGLHLIDFEQLKIENQTYNEKIEERNEELLKLRKKITTTVQVLTHVKEKLQFVQGENEQLRNEMYDVETSLAKKRDVLTRTKQVRDALRNDNMRLKQKCGLLGNEPLLRDFEERTDENDELRDKLERLKQQHLELTMNLNGMKRKVEKARSKTTL